MTSPPSEPTAAAVAAGLAGAYGQGVEQPLTYLVRHGRAEGHAPGGDGARRLTPAGRAEFAGLLRRLGPRLAVSRVVTSPFARARETADLLAAATGAPVEEALALASGGSNGSEILELARRAGPGTAVVGHNPELAEALALAAGSNAKVAPGTIAAVALDGQGARLAWIEGPDVG